ncbi:MAG TPA: carboxypeptidase regulatory-like domain-containing protein [Terracidiphilus sp.]|jgi:plastocyanin
MRLIGTAAFALSLLAVACSAQDISGTIVIKKRLTHRSVTASVSVYQRGTSVKLGNTADENPIAFERSRVVIYLEGSAAGNPIAAASASPAEIQQINRQFVPDLAVVPVGTTISFPNMDPIFHDVYSLSKVKSFDLGAYDKGQTRRVTFTKPGMIEVYCHLHPNMAATIVVLANRYYARPDRDGLYRIPNVPPGHYTLVAWHKTAGFFRRSIDVEPDHTTTADFLIPLDIDGKQVSANGHELEHGAGSR